MSKNATLTPRTVSLTVAATLAAAMGVGRFVYTPLVPHMIAQAGLSAPDIAIIATANYAGYFAGAGMLSLRPRWNTTRAFRWWCVFLVLSEIAVALGPVDVAWMSWWRWVAGMASAVIFVASAATLAHHSARGVSSGIGFAGVGGGIALTGVLILLASPHADWRELWMGASILTALLIAPALRLSITAEPVKESEDLAPTAHHLRTWRLLLGAYFLDGLGYIIFGTFIVAAVSTEHAERGQLVWIVVGVAAIPATMLWHKVGTRYGAEKALMLALALQALGVTLPAVTRNPLALLGSAALFGATFMGIAVLAIRSAAQLPLSRTAARLTTVYSVGQAIGPLVVIPLIAGSYRGAFVASGVILCAAAVLASAVVGSTHSTRAVESSQR